MTDALVISGVILLGCVIALWIYALDARDAPPARRQPQVRRLVISGSYAQACYHAVEQKWVPNDWRYVDSVEQVHGYHRDEVTVELVGEYARSPIWDQAGAITTLRMLGLSVFDPYELVPDGVLPS